MSTSDVVAEATQEVSAYPSPAAQEMIDAGVFYGRKKSKTHPKMRPYVLTNRSGIEIINLEKTAECLEKAVAFVQEKVRSGGQVLLVGTEPQAEEAILKLAARCNLSYVTTRWAGGTLTNFKIISKRIEYFKKLASDLAGGALDKYTKKERLGMEREIRRLRELFGGLEHFERMPDVMVVVNPQLHHAAVREARRLKIPVVALSNVDTDPAFIEYLVPGNDKSIKSIQWFLGKIEEAIQSGLAARVAEAARNAELAAAGAKQGAAVPGQLHTAHEQK